MEEEEHRLGTLAVPPVSGVGGGHGFVPHPGLASHTQPGALGSALNLASPQRPMAATRVLSAFQRGGYVTGTWTRIHFAHRTVR